MPIRFHCPKCEGLLSISRKLSGTETVCPQCEQAILIPRLANTKPTAADVKTKAPLLAAARSERFAPQRKPKTSEKSGTLSVTEDEDEDEDDEEDHQSRRSGQFMSDAIDMTAMVDVTFLLLIFFMVTATFAAQKVLETSAPEPDSEKAGAGIAVVENTEDLTSQSVVVEIDGHDQLRVDDQPVASLFELKQALTNKLLSEQKTEVLIQAQYEATHGMVVAVTDTALDVGMQRVRRMSRRDD